MIPLKDLELELQNDLIYIFKEDNNTGFCNFRLAISICFFKFASCISSKR